jgi:hypothetical protein
MRVSQYSVKVNKKSTLISNIISCRFPYSHLFLQVCSLSVVVLRRNHGQPNSLEIPDLAGHPAGVGAPREVLKIADPRSPFD